MVCGAGQARSPPAFPRWLRVHVMRRRSISTWRRLALRSLRRPSHSASTNRRARTSVAALARPLVLSRHGLADAPPMCTLESQAGCLTSGDEGLATRCLVPVAKLQGTPGDRSSPSTTTVASSPSASLNSPPRARERSKSGRLRTSANVCELLGVAHRVRRQCRSAGR